MSKENSADHRANISEAKRRASDDPSVLPSNRICKIWLDPSRASRPSMFEFHEFEE